MSEPTLNSQTDPLVFLRQTHRALLERCAELEALVTGEGPDPGAARALGRQLGALLDQHLRDEETELFARLVRVSLKLADQIHVLRQEHERLRAAWANLLPLLANPAGAAQGAAGLAEQAAAFLQLKRGHAAREEQLLNQAQHLLSDAALREMRNAMLERRGRHA
ncbi:MAG: hemerythrin domain-containing protein [Gammaproteobacteria bacterium]|nr:hemerythrin domain-containing protein [Gammaproteobacteria bacterium]